MRDIRKEVHQEQRYNLLVKDHMDYLRKQIGWLKVAVILLAIFLGLDIGLDFRPM